MTLLLLAAALFLSVNTGAGGIASSMAAPYGSGAVDRRTGLILFTLFVVIGAGFFGGAVVETMGSELLEAPDLGGPESKSIVALVILLTAGGTLFVANMLGVPLSTSEVMVSAIVGVGLYTGGVNWERILVVVIAWITLPALAIGLGCLVGRLNRLRTSGGNELDRVDRAGGMDRLDRAAGVGGGRTLSPRQAEGRGRRRVRYGLVAVGCLQAVAVGANNAANAAAPLVTAGLFTAEGAAWLGGAFLAVGAFAWGDRVLETGARGITKLSILEGCLASGTAATLVLVLSLYGVPVPIVQATMGAIIGVGLGREGRAGVHVPTVRRIASTWLICPITSFSLAWGSFGLFYHVAGAFVSL